MKANATDAYAFLVSVVKNAPFGILTYNLMGDISICNHLVTSHLQLNKSPGSIVDKPIQQIIKHIPELYVLIKKSIDPSRQEFTLVELPFNDGSVISIKGRNLTDGMILTTQDISPLKQLQRDNVTAVLKGQEKERNRLAKEIHDGVGPLMSTIKLNLDSIRNDLDPDLPESIALKFKSIQALINDVAEDIRSISHALMPSSLKDFGLRLALENLIQKINQTNGIQISLYYTGNDERLNIHTEIALYRITQELINNALKYSEANGITIQLIKYDKKIMLTVEDDGRGCSQPDVESMMAKGIGLQNIATRAEALRGYFTIDTNTNNGFTGTIEIPVF